MLDDIETETRTLSSSVVRHRPITPDAKNTQVQIRRASRVRQKPKPYSPDDLAFASPPSSHTPRHTPKTSRTWLIYVVLGMLMAMLMLWLGQIVFHWGQQSIDDLRYGRPRTTHVDHFVGHETGDSKTHFVAMNLGGTVYVIEMPGGSPDKSRLLVGQRLIGPGADLAPVSLSFSGDPQHPDLIVTVNGIEVKFRNTGSAYEPAS